MFLLVLVHLDYFEIVNSLYDLNLSNIGTLQRKSRFDHT